MTVCSLYRQFPSSVSSVPAVIPLQALLHSRPSQHLGPYFLRPHGPCHSLRRRLYALPLHISPPWALQVGNASSAKQNPASAHSISQTKLYVPSPSVTLWPLTRSLKNKNTKNVFHVFPIVISSAVGSGGGPSQERPQVSPGRHTAEAGGRIIHQRQLRSFGDGPTLCIDTKPHLFGVCPRRQPLWTARILGSRRNEHRRCHLGRPGDRTILHWE